MRKSAPHLLKVWKKVSSKGDLIAMDLAVLQVLLESLLSFLVLLDLSTGMGLLKQAHTTLRSPHKGFLRHMQLTNLEIL